ncbi:unnamed protein product, partial [Polarella glacialis]
SPHLHWSLLGICAAHQRGSAGSSGGSCSAVRACLCGRCCRCFYCIWRSCGRRSVRSGGARFSEVIESERLAPGLHRKLHGELYAEELEPLWCESADLLCTFHADK